MPIRRLLALAAALVLAVTACSGGTDDGGDPAPRDDPAHNAADVRFAQDMIPHHRQATEMAALAAERASSPQVKALAARVEKTQDPEIVEMAAWLEAWGEDVPAPGEQGGHDDMAGMLSAEELEDLAAQSGAAFDRSFLTLMIRHHEGAIAMARTQERDGRYPDAVALARAVESGQGEEIATMKGLLAG